MPNPAELHSASIELPSPDLHEAIIWDDAAFVTDVVRCVVPSFDRRFTTDPSPFNPVTRPSGTFYPKKGDRALVSYHDDGPSAIVEWWPAVGAAPDAVPTPPTSGADTNYVHTQAIAAATWTITHSLGKLPSIETYGPTGSQIEGEITALTTTTATVQFIAATSGKAVLN